MIALVDYGMGNLRSVANAFQAIGEKVLLTQSAADLEAAHGIILPGVGAFGDGMKNLKELGLIEPLRREVLGRGKPYLGICLGMQFLAEESQEHAAGGAPIRGFGWLKGRVVQIQTNDKRYKVPHMGWNDLKLTRGSDLFKGLPEEPVFYFVHSYHLETAEPGVLTAVCEHGATITAAVQKGTIYGVQFHPEKSQNAGLQLLRNFTAVAQSYAEKTADPCHHPA